MAKGMERRSLKAQETKRKLMEKAVELIGQRGYSGVSVSQICAACGVSKGAYYVYYNSKEDIVYYLASEFNETLYQRLNEELDYENAQSARQLYQHYVEIYVDQVIQYGRMFSRAYQEGMLRTGISQEQIRSDLPEEHISRIIDFGIQTGEFRPDVDKAAFWEQLTITKLGSNYAWSIEESVDAQHQRERALRWLGSLELFLLKR